MTRYSWPRAVAARAIVSIDAPPSLHVEWVWQSPLSAARSAAPSPSGITRGLAPGRRAVGDLAVERLGDDRGGAVADAGQLGQRPVASAVGRARRRGGRGPRRPPWGTPPPSATASAPGRAGRRPARGPRPDPCGEGRRGRGRAGAAFQLPAAAAIGASGRPGSLRPDGTLRVRRTAQPGKSSLYNALAGGGALAAPYAFATTDPNVGVAKVPDARLDRLAAMSASKKVVPASVQFVDIGGLVEGASTGEGLGNRSSPTSARSTPSSTCCGRSSTPTCPGPTTRSSACASSRLELALADLETVETQHREAAQGGQAGQVARRRGRRARRRLRRPRRRARRSTAATCRPTSGRCCAA